MSTYNTNYEIAQAINQRIGTAPVPFEDLRNLSFQIYQELGGENSIENFDDIYQLLLTTRSLAREGGAGLIDDTSVRTDKTWSSNKINSELSSKQGALTAGENIDITDNTISAVGYLYDETKGAFATKFLKDGYDGGGIGTNNASGNYGSFAEGYDNTASGEYGSHAEGFLNTASGDSAHVEGQENTATHSAAHAEGRKTNATNNGAHAEGNYSDASGVASHAEGWGSKNYHNIASGDGSHTEGICTRSQNYAEHAQGAANVSHKTASNAATNWQGDGNHTLHSIGNGQNLNTQSNAVEVMQNADVYIKGVGDYDGVHIKSEAGYETVKTLQQVINGKQDTLTAGQNIVITNNTISAVVDAGFQVEVVQTLPETGEANTIYFVPKAGGANPDAYDEYMYINNAWEKIGSTEVDLSNYYNKTEVDGLLSGKQDKLTAGNNITINGTTISANDTTYSAGTNIDITDNAIKAVGYRYNTTNGAFAEGDRDVVEGETTFIKSTATGLMSHAEGSNTKANGRSSHAEGQETIASGYYSHSEGYKSKAQKGTCHAEGNNTTASGDAAHAEGYSTTASGKFAHAEGSSTQATGDSAHTEGSYAIAIGSSSHAEGTRTKANGNNSHTEGASTVTNGSNTHAEGRFTKTLCNSEHAQGSYNVSHKATNSTSSFDGNAGNTIHSIGIGTAEDARKNAVEVMQNGDAYLFGVGNYDGVHIKGETGAPSGLKTLQETVNGKQDKLTAGQNIYIGGNTISAEGYEYFPNNSIITNGASCTTDGESSHAEGYQCVTEQTAPYSHAEGWETVVRNQNEHAQGKHNVSHTVDATVTNHEGNTIVSVGIGEDDANRKNAFEIMQNGDIYVYGLGNYNGTATKSDNPDIKTLQDILKTIAEATGIDIGVLF